MQCGRGRERWESATDKAMRRIPKTRLEINLIGLSQPSCHHHRPHSRACPLPVRLFGLFPRCRHLHRYLSHRPAGHTMARNVALERFCNRYSPEGTAKMTSAASAPRSCHNGDVVILMGHAAHRLTECSTGQPATCRASPSISGE